MPAFVAVLIVLAVVYQVFFRFDHWVDANNSGKVYERDNLTGEVHTVKANEKRSLMSRIVGHLDNQNEKKAGVSAYSMRRLDGEGKPVPAYGVEIPLPGDDTDAGMVPVAMMAVDADGKSLSQSKTDATLASNASAITSTPPASKTGTVVVKNSEPQKLFDLNRDGQAEQLMMRSEANDGLLDISVLQDQRELFYGRGKALQVLSTSRAGWNDVALVLADGKPMVFQYNPAHGGYEVKQ